MPKRPYHVGCEHTGLGICYCLEGTPEHLRDPEAAERFCQRGEDLAELWATVCYGKDTPEEADVLFSSNAEAEANTKSKSKARNGIWEFSSMHSAGLKEAQSEVENARASAERHALKAARKANSLGLSHNLLESLELEEAQVSFPIAEESVDQKLRLLQSQQDQIRQEIRGMDKQKEEMGTDTEKDACHIADVMEATLQKLSDIKGKLPPDRVSEVVSVEEAAQLLVTKARKTRRKPRRLLRPEDISESLAGSWLSVFWPGDNQWWNGFVQSVNTSQATATLFYATDEAEEVNLRQLTEKGEVAWLEIPTASDSISKRRKKHHTSNP